MVIISFTTTAIYAQSKDEIKVAAAVEALRDAMVKADKTTLDNITADVLSYGHSSGKIQNKTEFIQALVSGESDFTDIQLSGQVIQLHNNTAIVRHIMTAQTNDNGKPGNVKIAILLVWHKEHKQWKLIARQAVKI